METQVLFLHTHAWPIIMGNHWIELNAIRVNQAKTLHMHDQTKLLLQLNNGTCLSLRQLV